MNYEQALEYTRNIKIWIETRFENIRNLLGFMDNPHKKLKYIHVAGQMGKVLPLW